MAITTQCFLIAFHYPKPEHRAEMVDRLNHAARVIAGVAGCLDAGCWEDGPSGAVVATGRFESDVVWRRALAAVAAANVDFDFDSRESRPRDVYALTEPSPSRPSR